MLISVMIVRIGIVPACMVAYVLVQQCAYLHVIATCELVVIAWRILLAVNLLCCVLQMLLLANLLAARILRLCLVFFDFVSAV